MATDGASDVNFEEFDFDSLATSSNYIDKGAFGEVYGPFTWNSRMCAFKRIWIPKGRPGDDFKIKVEDKKSIWTTTKHKNLIEIHNVTLRPKALYIIMEYADGGSLRLLLDISDVTVQSQIDVSNWATQIANGMLYLHEKNIVHRDLKSDNSEYNYMLIMLDSNSLGGLKANEKDKSRLEQLKNRLDRSGFTHTEFPSAKVLEQL